MVKIMERIRARTWASFRLQMIVDLRNLLNEIEPFWSCCDLSLRCNIWSFTWSSSGLFICDRNWCWVLDEAPQVWIFEIDEVADEWWSILLLRPWANLKDLVKDNHSSSDYNKQQNIDHYFTKYRELLESCSDAKSRLCLIIEDDAIPINDEKIMKQRLVMNTLSLFTNERVSWDCSKRGIG